MTPSNRVRSAVRRSRQLSVVSLVFAGVAVATTGATLAVGACGGWVLALVAVGFALAAVNHSFPASAEEHTTIRRSSLLVGAATCAALLVGQTWLILSVLRSSREIAWNTCSAANLGGIGKAVAWHAEESRSYPSTFQGLLRDAGVNPKALLSPLDTSPGWVETSDPNVMLVYSSYIYVPGHGAWANDPRIIIAYERMPFGSTGPLIARRPVRCVLFDDGRVEILEEDAFQRAWQQDRQRRRELGWPIDPNEPIQPPTSQPGSVLTWPAG